MSRFPSRFERPLPNTAGRRPGGLRSLAGSTIGTNTPDGAPRVRVAGVQADQTAGSLAEILNRGSIAATQSLAIINRNRAAADVQFRREGQQFAAEAAPELRARIAQFGVNDLDGFDIEAEVDGQLGDGVDPALRSGFRDALARVAAAETQDRRTTLDRVTRQEITDSAIAGLSTIDQSDEPDTALASATEAFFQANPDATDADFARAVVPVLDEAATTGNERLFNLLGGVVESALPEQFGQASRRLDAVQERRAFEDEQALLGDISDAAARVRIGELSKEAFQRQFGDRLESRPTLREQIENSFASSDNQEIIRQRRRLEAAAISGSDDFMQQRQELAALEDPDGANELLIARADQRFATELRQRAALRQQQTEVLIAEQIKAGRFGVARSMAASAFDSGFLDRDTRTSIESEIGEREFRQTLAANDAATLTDPTIPGNASTFTTTTYERPDGRTVTVSGHQRASDAYKAEVARVFGPGRSPLREYIAGGEVGRDAIEANITLMVNSGYQPERLVAEVNGAMTSASEDPTSQTDEVMRAMDVARRLKERGFTVVGEDTNGQILRSALALSRTGVARNDAQAVARAANRIRRIEASPSDMLADISSKKLSRLIDRALPNDLDDDPYARNLVSEMARQYQVYMGVTDAEDAFKAAEEQFRLDHAEIGGQWINTTRIQIDDGRISAGTRVLRLYAESLGIENSEARVDNYTGLMLVPGGGARTPTIDAEDIRTISLYLTRIQAYESLRSLAEARDEIDVLSTRRDGLLNIDDPAMGVVRGGIRPILEWMRDNRDTVTARRRAGLDALGDGIAATAATGSFLN